MHTPGIPVEAFGVYPSRGDELLAYPGPRPDGSFLTTGEVVLEQPEAPELFEESVNEHLDAAGQPLLADRIPLLAYGANANPARIRDKLAKYGLAGAELHVPYARVSVPDVAAVWHGRPGQSGSIFAELYQGPEVEGGELRTHLSYVTPEQAAVIHATEGATYSLAEIEAHVSGPEARKALAYVGLDASVLLKEDRHKELQPVGVAGLSNATPLETMTAEEAVDYVLEQDGVAELAGASGARELVLCGLELTLAEKKARQMAVGGRLRELGLSREYVHPAGGFVGRLALGSQLAVGKHEAPEVYHLAEQTLAALRGGNGTPDIMKALRNRARGEIAVLLRNETER